MSTHTNPRCCTVRPALLLFAGMVLARACYCQDDSRPRAVSGTVTVQVDATQTRNLVAPRALGIQASALDAGLKDPALPALLRDAGVLTLSYPGGPATDQFHWASNTMTYREGNSGAVDKGTDFGAFARMLDKLGGTAVISVNYGSSAHGKGGGDPEEAAAWVAYANGNPSDTHPIGKDASGFDWQTTGYWATMRGATPLAADDGYNFLRISHPAPLNIKYWAVGNDVYGNGYYGKEAQGYSDDHHAAFGADEGKSAKLRTHNPALSAAAYGEGVAKFAKAMKAVDGRIAVGAGLNTPGDNSWGPDWNPGVLKACAADIDFVVLHWYAGRSLPPDWKNLDTFDSLYATSAPLTAITTGLIELFKKYSGGKMLQLAVTEVGIHNWLKITDSVALGLLAADDYASLAEDGAVNVDWHELHDESFLGGNDNTPGPAFYGVTMMHRLANMRDLFVVSKSSSDLVAVHAVKRADGSIGIMLINKDPKNAANVKVQTKGDPLAAQATRFEWGKSAAVPSKTNVDGLGNAFSVSVPAYSVVDLIVPRASK